jgi:uncharacterized iron-regulated membrane protein
MKKLTRKFHLILGLIIGIIIIIVSLTGCIYAFQEEIQDLTQEYRYVKSENQNFLKPSELKVIAEKSLPNKVIHSITYSEKDRAAIVSFYSPNPEYYYLMFVNPYSGKVLKNKNMDDDFFRIILMGHYYLWLPPWIGQPIVATSTLLFLFMLISGIILWWPKRNKNAIKQRFKIKWQASWRRKNFDLHSVLGFYVSWIAIFIVITGLVMGFEWFSNAYYFTITGGKSKISYYESYSSDKHTKVLIENPVDYLWSKTLAENPKIYSIEVHFPETKKSSISIVSNSEKSTFWKNDFRYYDQNSLRELKVKHQYGKFSKNLKISEKLMRMNYDIHVGGIFGIAGKIIMFFASLICASLPVTGFMMWYGRRNKS